MLDAMRYLRCYSFWLDTAQLVLCVFGKLAAVKRDYTQCHCATMVTYVSFQSAFAHAFSAHRVTQSYFLHFLVQVSTTTGQACRGSERVREDDHGPRWGLLHSLPLRSRNLVAGRARRAVW